MVYYGLKWSEPVRVAPEIVLTEEQTSELTKLSRSGCTSVRLAQRARIVLLASQGWDNKDMAQEVGVGRVAVARWRQRYLESGIEGIERDLPRGAPPTKVDVAKLVELTTQAKPLNVLHGQVIGQCQQRHTHAEWLKFLKKIDRETPKDKTLHLIADN